MSDEIPFVEVYKGVGIHDQQPRGRIGNVVKPEIDRVLQMSHHKTLADHAADQANAPESRLLAAAMVGAIYTIAVEERRERPPIDVDLVKATVAGLQTRKWRSRNFYCSLLDTRPPGQCRAVKRETPLPADD